MDATTQQAKVDQLTAAVQADQTAITTSQTQLTSDQEALTQAQAELADVDFINKLEALTPDQVTTINAALASDPDNHSQITLTLPAPAPVPNENPAP